MPDIIFSKKELSMKFTLKIISDAFLHPVELLSVLPY